MLSTLIKRQLIAFVVVSVVAMAVLGIRYLEIPASMGVGRYEVSLSMPDASGLYAGAPVTYRGVQIGKVARTTLTVSGTTARLTLEDKFQVPASARADVQNGSVIGEPYVDLVDPDSDTGSDTGTRDLHDGDTIPSSRVTLPVSTADMLTKVQALMASVPKDALKTTLEESATALGVSTTSLQRIVDAGSLLTTTATQQQQPTLDLIDNAERVLSTQDSLHGQIRSWATNLDTFSAALDRADPDLRKVLARTGPTVDTLIALLQGLRTSAPALFTDTANLGEVLNVYQPALRTLLIVFPGLIEANGSAQNYYPDQNYGESGLSFKLTVNDPPVCVQGFPEAGHMRAPEDLRPKALPKNSYCKVAHSDPRVVRGARNAPCPNDPNRRGALASSCGLIFNPKESPE